MHIPQNISTYYNGNIETLRGRNDPEAIKAVAKEMEALFAYELIKAMRKTANTESKDGLGRDTYESIFDMELARLFAEKGLGLQDMLLKGLNKEVGKGEAVDTDTVISLVGSTGKSTGPPLHFEVRYDGKSTDPVTIIV